MTEAEGAWVEAQAERLAGAPQAELTAAAEAVLTAARTDGVVYGAVWVGSRLRDQGRFGPADAVLGRVLDDPALRVEGLWELGRSHALQGRPAEAIALFQARLAERPLSPAQLVIVAAQHARVGEVSTAHGMLNTISLADPALKTECMAEAQFYKLLGRYDRAAAMAMLEAVHARYEPASTEAIEARIAQRLERGEPYMLLRMGDGEGSHIKLDLNDEQEFGILYGQNRRAFLELWFGDAGLLGEPAYEATIDAFNDVIGEADCIGAFSPAAVDYAYTTGSRRDVTWVVNTLRKTLALAERDPAWAARTQVNTLTVHYDLLTSGALERLLRGRASVGLISCHAALGPALQERFGIGTVELFRTPGEQGNAALLGEAATAGRHWPDRYRALCAELDGGDRRGQLFLVAAGFLGKLYAARLKRAGAVVLDIGAVADLLMGKATRTFPPGASAFVLPAVTQAPAPSPPTRPGWRGRFAALLRRSRSA